MIKMRDTAAWQSPMVQETLSVLEARFNPSTFNSLAQYMQLSDVLEPTTLCALIVMDEVEAGTDIKSLRPLMSEEVQQSIDVFDKRLTNGPRDFDCFFETPTMAPLKLMLATFVHEVSTHEAFATSDKGAIQDKARRMADDMMDLTQGLIHHRMAHEIPEKLMTHFCTCSNDLSEYILDRQVRSAMQASIVTLRQTMRRPTSSSPHEKRLNSGMN